MLKIIAEVGSVHDGSFGNACRLIEATADCGADAVKFQTHIASAESLRDAPSPAYFNQEPRYEYFERTSFSLEQWRQLAQVCKDSNVEFLSSPFSIEAVDLLEKTGIAAFKIPSGEVTNIPLLERVAATGKPVLLSSGMSNWEELDVAVNTLGRQNLTIMQCTSMYPCPPEYTGLNVIREMQERYGVQVGFSDHTFGPAAAFAAVTSGATVIEKHFTFSRLMYGSDAKNSMEPHEFKSFCEGLKSIELMLQNPVDKSDLVPFEEMRIIFQKSVVLAQAVKAGTVLSRDCLAFKKPGNGIPSSRYKELIGKKVKKDLAIDHMLDWGDVE